MQAHSWHWWFHPRYRVMVPPAVPIVKYWWVIRAMALKLRSAVAIPSRGTQESDHVPESYGTEPGHSHARTVERSGTIRPASADFYQWLSTHKYSERA
jgi:hypothetical protein